MVNESDRRAIVEPRYCAEDREAELPHGEYEYLLEVLRVHRSEYPSLPLDPYLVLKKRELFDQTLQHLFFGHFALLSFASFFSRLDNSFTTPSMIALGLAGHPGIYAETVSTLSIPDSTL